MAVVKVSRKKSRAAIVAFAGLAATDDGGAGREQDGRPIRGRVGVRHRSADRAPVAHLRIADGRGHVVEERIAVADDRRLVDPAVRRPGADPRARSSVSAIPSRPVTSRRSTRRRRLREAELDQGKQAVAAGQQLRLAFPVLEDPERLGQVGRTHVVELPRNHRAATLLPAHAGRCRPIRPGWAQNPWRRSRAGGRVTPSGDDDRGSGGLGMRCGGVSAPDRSHVNVSRGSGHGGRGPRIRTADQRGCPGHHPGVGRDSAADGPALAFRTRVRPGPRGAGPPWRRPDRSRAAAATKPSRASRDSNRRGSPATRTTDGSRPRARSSSTSSGRAGRADRASPWTAGQNGSAAEAGGCWVRTPRTGAGPPLEGVEERPDRLDVVADVRDEHDVGIEGARVGRWPASLDGPDVLDRVVLGDLAQALEHRRRRRRARPPSHPEGSSARAIGSANRPGACSRHPASGRPTGPARAARSGSDRRFASGRPGRASGPVRRSRPRRGLPEPARPAPGSPGRAPPRPPPRHGRDRPACPRRDCRR